MWSMRTCCHPVATVGIAFLGLEVTWGPDALPDGAVAGEAGSLRACVIAGEGLTGMGPSA